LNTLKLTYDKEIAIAHRLKRTQKHILSLQAKNKYRPEWPRKSRPQEKQTKPQEHKK